MYSSKERHYKCLLSRVLCSLSEAHWNVYVRGLQSAGGSFSIMSHPWLKVSECSHRWYRNTPAICFDSRWGCSLQQIASLMSTWMDSSLVLPTPSETEDRCAQLGWALLCRSRLFDWDHCPCSSAPARKENWFIERCPAKPGKAPPPFFFALTDELSFSFLFVLLNSVAILIV